VTRLAPSDSETMSVLHRRRVCPGGGLGLSSVEPAGITADLAPGGAGCGVDGEIARAAVRAAIESAGAGGAASKTTHRDGAARNRRGRGSRIQWSPDFLLVACLAGAIRRSARQRDRYVRLHDPTHSEDRSRGFLSPGRRRERVGLDRRFVSTDLGIIARIGDFVK
jgi:hypothetical protein